MTMTFGVLGPLVVTSGGAPVRIPGAKLRALLGALLLNANQVVSHDQLAGALWGTALPVDVRGSLQVYVARLRTLLDSERIGTRPDGYQISVSASGLDLLRFDALVADASVAPSPSVALDALRRAVALWRGSACGGALVDPQVALDTTAVTERYLRAQERRFDLELREGAHAEVVGDLLALTGAHPFRERFWGQLMLALYRAGRQSEAIAAYWTLAGQLADDLGIDPGPQVRELYLSIVRSDPQLRPDRTTPRYAVLTRRQRLRAPRTSRASSGSARWRCPCP